MSISPFVASPIIVVRRLLTLAELKPSETYFDLGAGNGRTVIMAAKEFGAKAFGVELRDDLAKQAMEQVEELGLRDKVTIIHGNMFDADLSQADVVYLYLTTSANEKVKPKLESELKKTARTVSHDYEIVGWKATQVEHFCENPKLGFPTHTLYLYKR
jgi:predicted RNA methylase